MSFNATIDVMGRWPKRVGKYQTNYLKPGISLKATLNIFIHSFGGFNVSMSINMPKRVGKSTKHPVV